MTYFRQVAATKAQPNQDKGKQEQEDPLSQVDRGMLSSDYHFRPIMPEFRPRLTSPDKRRNAVSLSVSHGKTGLAGRGIQPLKMHGTKDHLIRGRRIGL